MRATLQALVTAGILLAALPLVTPPARGENPLVILSPHNEAIREEFETAFSRWHSTRFGQPVDIDWRMVGGSSESIRFVLSEFSRKPDGIGIDLFFGGGHEPFYELAEKHLAVPHPLPKAILDGLGSDVAGIELRAADFSWYGAAISTFGILQNLRVLERTHLPRVQRWEDLVRPELKGWVGAGDPRGSGTMHVMFESFLQAKGWNEGWNLLTRLAGNTRRFDRISSTTAKDAAVGETAYALSVDFFAFTQIAAAGKTNLTFILPVDFAAVSPDGIAMLRGAPHSEIARRFLEFVLSDSGQKLWFLPRGHPEGPVRHSIERMPVRPALYQTFADISNIPTSPFDLPAGFRYDARRAQQRRGVVATLAGAMFVDVHDDLKSAWDAIIQRGLRPDDLAEFGKPPLTESEARDLAAQGWREAAVRAERRSAWQRWAQQKFRRLAHAAATPTPPALP